MRGGHSVSRDASPVKTITWLSPLSSGLKCKAAFGFFLIGVTLCAFAWLKIKKNPLQRETKQVVAEV